MTYKEKENLLKIQNVTATMAEVPAREPVRIHGRLLFGV